MTKTIKTALITIVGILTLASSTASAEAWARSYSNRAWGNWSAGGSTPWFAGGGGTLRNGGFPGGYPSFHRAPAWNRASGPYYTPAPRIFRGR